MIIIINHDFFNFFPFMKITDNTIINTNRTTIIILITITIKIYKEERERKSKNPAHKYGYIFIFQLREYPCNITHDIYIYIYRDRQTDCRTMNIFWKREKKKPMNELNIF